ncbi:hypothetical protein XaC1_13 [Xanthomonas phage XaC1]|nr:hypothetical protein XaC1_13 [Xanthomonas phage XaC1]
MYQNIEVLNTKERREEIEKLGKMALETNLKHSTITRFYKPGDVRHYDFDKLTPDLIGKVVRIEYYSTGNNPETGIWSGCYREIIGTVTYLTPGVITNVGYLVLDGNKCISAHSGHDFTLEVLQ